MRQKASIAIISILLLLIVIMEVQTNLSKAKETANPIPEDAIRLRILANSDSAADQSVKRQIRDAVNADVEGWVHHLKTADQAKQVIRDHLDEVRNTVSEKLAKMGLEDEAFAVKLGKADFPTKMYGGFVYPAGDYEALVITLGKGTGANWWCVLFPPLCFLDFSNGDAVKTEDGEPKAKEPSNKTHTVEAKPAATKSAATKSATTKSPTTKSATTTSPATDNAKNKDSEKDKPEVKFFLVDIFDGIANFFSHLF